MLKTALTLTDDQLQAMVRHVRARIEEMEAARCAGWLPERERFEREWENDFSHRAADSALFSRSNETLNMVGAGVDYIRARLIEEIFGAKPWLRVEARSGNASTLLAQQASSLNLDIERHLRWKLEGEPVHFEMLAADLVTRACTLGECATKVFYQREEERYERVARVLWDEEGDAPVLTADGDYLFEEDAPERVAAALEALGAALEWQPGRAEWLPAGFAWREQIVSERRLRWAGARAVPLHYKEFFCPLNAPSVHEADFVAHLTSMRLSQLREHLGEFENLEEAAHVGAANAGSQNGMVQNHGIVPNGSEHKSAQNGFSTFDGESGSQNASGGEGTLARALRRIREEWGARAASARAARSASREARAGELNAGESDGGDPEIRVAEAYFRFDARGDVKPCRVFLMVAYDYDLPVFWDYVANVTPDGRYPFEVVVANRVPHRWYGQSWFQKYERYQALIDRLANQIIYRNELAANPVKFRRKEAVVQWQDGEPFEAGPDCVYDLNDGYSAEDALQTSTIPELDEQTRFLLETVVANWRMRAGVLTATQGSFEGMSSERTATGIMQMANVSQTLFKPLLLEVKRGLEAVLRQLAVYEYAGMEEDEVFDYTEGGERRSGVLRWALARGAAVDAELPLTFFRQGQSVECSKLAVDFFERFLAVPDGFKPVAAPLFSSLYKGLQIDNAEGYFERVAERAGQSIGVPDAGEPTGLAAQGGAEDGASRGESTSVN